MASIEVRRAVVVGRVAVSRKSWLMRAFGLECVAADVQGPQRSTMDFIRKRGCMAGVAFGM
jgi:hypothetical protein